MIEQVWDTQRKPIWRRSRRPLLWKALSTSCGLLVHPTQSIIYVPLEVIRFQKSILLIVQYKYFKSFSGDFILQNLILRIRSCGISFITQSSWGFHFNLTETCQMEMFVPQSYQLRRGISGGPALKHFYVIHRGGRTPRGEIMAKLMKSPHNTNFFCVPDQKEWWENRSSRFEPRCEVLP